MSRSPTFSDEGTCQKVICRDPNGDGQQRGATLLRYRNFPDVYYKLFQGGGEQKSKKVLKLRKDLKLRSV